jgi:enoyl-CoA hydratase/carnithine racemase
MSAQNSRDREAVPASLHVERQGEIALLRLNRPEKRNALNDPTVLGIGAFFAAIPDGVQAVVIHGAGEHFCAGLDLSELEERDVAQGVLHSRMWHKALDEVQFGTVPVVAVLHGAVVGGGLFLTKQAGTKVGKPK